jgi:hypothetical protein
MSSLARLALFAALLTSLLLAVGCGDDASEDGGGNNAAANNGNNTDTNNTDTNNTDTNNTDTNNTDTNNTDTNNTDTNNPDNNVNNPDNNVNNPDNNVNNSNNADAVAQCEGLCDTIAACDGIAAECPAEAAEAFLTGCKERCGEPAFQEEIAPAAGAPCEVVVPLALESAGLSDECGGGELPESCDEIGAEACFTNDDCQDASTRCQNVGIDLPCCVPGERGAGVPGDDCTSENDCSSALCIESYCAPSTCETNTDCPTELPCCIAIGGVGNLCLPASDSTCQP